MKNPTPEQQDIYTVSQLNAEARLIIEECFSSIWIMGEISNLAKPSSGHFYFSLKDERAQIRCAYFRHNHKRLRFDVENGQQVLVQAQVSIYEAQGSYQLIVQHMEIAGTGALQVAFEQLKKNLEKEGLFSPEFKKEIPLLPRQIGVITSATGAAVRDILKVLKRRFANIPVVIYPTMVQGDKAAAQIVSALKIANRRNECDVLILARGGGSLEDLWPFNEEIVARAIFKSTIPIVTGIGHEINFTIADFVADQRAPTPSAAAEWVSPDKTEWLQQTETVFNRLQHIMHSELRHHRVYLDSLSKRLQHPGRRLQDYFTQLNILRHRLITAMTHETKHKQHRLIALSKSLHALSPLNVLDRGFAIVTATDTQTILRKARDVNVGETVTARLAEGRLDCRVEKIYDK
ncbi:exodeoxyribonuclease VII large subunit [Candidiatus Paracoxiella cheracis]|uniref:exodeoxyribonuclease VII large subunit n=1 Tax=Candidiatus Paracoxiella cheracis TaxID=3405120 RepID=UPI003BF498CD